MDYQDVLAKVGAGTAHPGGFTVTKEWIKALHFHPSLAVLEVGCGTGRTLTELVRRFDCKAIGLDVRRAMIEKAARRSHQAGVTVDWMVGSAEHLPIDTASVDLLITESVNVFVGDVHRALKEYRRVLKPTGSFVDVEMFLRAPVDSNWKKQAHRVYGVLRVPDQPGWKRLFRSAGFETVKVLSSRSIEPGVFMTDDDVSDVDTDMANQDAYQDPEVIRILRENAGWMEANYSMLGYATYLCSPGRV